LVRNAEEIAMTEQLTIDGRVVYVRRDRYGIAAVSHTIEALESVLGTAPANGEEQPSRLGYRPAGRAA
jgi:hypothetical protein